MLCNDRSAKVPRETKIRTKAATRMVGAHTRKSRLGILMPIQGHALSCMSREVVVTRQLSGRGRDLMRAARFVDVNRQGVYGLQPIP
jgi:hypothetical protein